MYSTLLSPPFLPKYHKKNKNSEGMNESKLLKNPNKCPMITINLNEKKCKNLP